MPSEASFCTKQGNLTYQYKTDEYGGRIFNNENFDNQIQVFGDSQVLGIDIEKTDQHYLHKLYKESNFVIYAAPNNGPYEVISFLKKNKIILNKKIIVTFNFSVDLYRVSNSWSPENFVALKEHELDEILASPYKYQIIIFKNLLQNKNFTISRNDIKKMQNIFLNLNQETINDDLIKYFNELDETANRLDVEIDFIVTNPYWVYSFHKDKNKLLLEKELNSKVERLICSAFKRTKKISRVLISKLPYSLEVQDFTFDKRHLKSDKIDLLSYQNLCKA